MSDKFQEKQRIIFAKKPSRMRCFITTAKCLRSSTSKVILSTFQLSFGFKNDFVDVARISFVRSSLVICPLRYVNYCLVYAVSHVEQVTSQRAYDKVIIG